MIDDGDKGGRSWIWLDFGQVGVARLDGVSEEHDIKVNICVKDLNK